MDLPSVESLYGPQVNARGYHLPLNAKLFKCASLAMILFLYEKKNKTKRKKKKKKKKQKKKKKKKKKKKHA